MGVRRFRVGVKAPDFATLRASGVVATTLRGMRDQLIPEALALVTPAQVVFFAVVVVALTVAGFWLWALIDVLSWPSSTWNSSGLSRARWASRVILLGWIGAVWYVRSPRRHLKTAYTKIRWATTVNDSPG